MTTSPGRLISKSQSNLSVGRMGNSWRSTSKECKRHDDFSKLFGTVYQSWTYACTVAQQFHCQRNTHHHNMFTKTRSWMFTVNHDSPKCKLTKHEYPSICMIYTYMFIYKCIYVYIQTWHEWLKSVNFIHPMLANIASHKNVYTVCFSL